MIPDRPFRRDLCESAKRGQLCIDDLDYDDMVDDEEDAICTCDFDEVENCPVHYPIDDGSEDDDCMDCGRCDACVALTRDFYEGMEKETPKPLARPNGKSV